VNEGEGSIYRCCPYSFCLNLRYDYDLVLVTGVLRVGGVWERGWV